MGSARIAIRLRRPALGLAALLSACAPAPALRYASADPADRWEAGVQWHTATAGGLACSASFAGDDFASVPGYASGRTLAFRMMLRNRSAAPARIDPAGFRLYSPRFGIVFPAVDPESALADLDLRRRIALSRLADAKARAEADTLRSGREEERQYRRTLRDLEEEARLWSEAHLRRTDLDSGRAMAGRLTFLFARTVPPDTLVLQWRPPGGRAFDLGRYGRPRIAADEPGSLARWLVRIQAR